MADRFPSIEELTAGQSSLGLNPENTAAGDFLSREQAALGDDARLFASPNDNYKSSTVEDDDDDLLGGGGIVRVENVGGEEVTEFESAFPIIDHGNERVAPGGTITGSNEPFLTGRAITPSYSVTVEDEEEPEIIKQWRERRDLALQAREEKSALRKAETVKTAQIALDDFYENYNTKKDKTIAQTRKEAEDFLANREDTAAGGTSWERIAKLVDLSGKGVKGGASGTVKERFRELLLSLRKDEKAPGATGY
ncbi:hypothetical protein FGG08_005109 [Glutinoglossum americanum]|uniref:Clathrin light chain n=1 Tax=Glutinoglossum americanum TaxID=1670608 RepID=A0A9P8L378_9PEZI|nr:hypothetical protein FGG08_005109 [Glutinoglossum americanum]